MPAPRGFKNTGAASPEVMVTVKVCDAEYSASTAVSRISWVYLMRWAPSEIRTRFPNTVNRGGLVRVIRSGIVGVVKKKRALRHQAQVQAPPVTPRQQALVWVG